MQWSWCQFLLGVLLDCLCRNRRRRCHGKRVPRLCPQTESEGGHRVVAELRGRRLLRALRGGTPHRQEAHASSIEGQFLGPLKRRGALN